MKKLGQMHSTTIIYMLSCSIFSEFYIKHSTMKIYTMKNKEALTFSISYLGLKSLLFMGLWNFSASLSLLDS